MGDGNDSADHQLKILPDVFSLSQKFRREESGILKYIAAFGITDEIFGISAAQEGKVSVFYNYGAMCVAIPGWTLGTLVGGISGSLLPDFMLSALSVAIYGMFLAIIIPPSKRVDRFLEWLWHPWQSAPFCGDTGIKTGIIRIYDHYHNTSGSRPGSLFLSGGREGGSIS